MSPSMRRASPLPSAALVLFAVAVLACALPAGAHAGAAVDLEDDAISLVRFYRHVKTYLRPFSDHRRRVLHSAGTNTAR
jgi:hypothetical protein